MFNFLAVDTIPPVVTCPASRTENSPTGAAVPVTFAATGTDTSGGQVTFTYTPASGSNFAVGQTTTVTVVGRDPTGNQAAPCTFTITVIAGENYH